MPEYKVTVQFNVDAESMQAAHDIADSMVECYETLLIEGDGEEVWIE